MVKNTGGNKTKGQARKFINTDDKKDTKILRESEDPLEIYCQVEKVLGNGMYNVICMDGKNRLCHSSGKFKGRNKKDNFVSLGSWLLIGLRQYESGGNNKKLQNCDLLEVYNDIEKERLKTTVNQDWSVFIKNDAANSFITKEVVKSSENFTFGDTKTMEYQELMAAELAKPSEKRGIVTVAGGDVIDIDDI
jgi:initiation factor 1A